LDSFNFLRETEGVNEMANAKKKKTTKRTRRVVEDDSPWPGRWRALGRYTANVLGTGLAMGLGMSIANGVQSKMNMTGSDKSYGSNDLLT
jgi:hypothetical protein